MAARALALLLLFVTLSTSFELKREIVEVDEITAIPWPFTVCGQADWTIENLVLASTPKRNTSNDMTMTGTASASITFSIVNLNVKLNGVFLDKQTVDFTDSFDSGDTIQFKFKQFIPSFAPSGTYTLTFDFQDSKPQSNGCLQFQFKM